jgi:hypothetical protein
MVSALTLLGLIVFAFTSPVGLKSGLAEVDPLDGELSFDNGAAFFAVDEELSNGSGTNPPFV